MNALYDETDHVADSVEFSTCFVDDIVSPPRSITGEAEQLSGQNGVSSTSENTNAPNDGFPVSNSQLDQINAPQIDTPDVQCFSLVGGTSEEQHSLLTLLCSRNTNIESLKCLLESGFPKNLRNHTYHGKTAFEWTIEYNNSENGDCVKQWETGCQ